MKKANLKAVCMMLLAIMLMGCSNGGTQSSTGTNDARSEAGAEDKNTQTSKGLIIYSQKTLDQYFHVALQESIKRAVEGKGYDFEATVCDFDSSLQTQQFQTSIAKRPTVIIANPVDSDALIDAAAKAKEAGIPVGVVDNKITGGKIDITVTFDNKLAGKMAAQEIVKRLEEKYGSAKGRVVNVYGAMSSEAWRLRKEGFEEIMEQYTDINYIAVPGEGDQTRSLEALKNAIAQYGEIDAVHCPSDAPGRGLIEALKIADQWEKVGEEGHVIFVTIDGEPVGVQNVQEGYFDACIVQDALAYGPVALDIIEQYILEGNPIPTSGEYVNEDYYWQKAEFENSDVGASLILPPYVMDASNVSDSRHWGKIAVDEWGLTYN